MTLPEHRRVVSVLEVVCFTHLVEELRVTLISTNYWHIGTLDGIHATFGRLSDVVLMFPCAHSKIDA